MSTRYQHAIFCVSGSIWGLHALRRTRTLQGIATLNSCPGRNGHSYEAALLREIGRCLGGRRRSSGYRYGDEVEHES
jgi:hypothetical protein